MLWRTMRITIAERLRPFVHVPGSYFILPGTSLRLQIFPVLLRIEDLSGRNPQLITEIKIDIKGPLKEFTVMQDLERGEIKVWGHSFTGFLRYCINAVSEQTMAITIEKSPLDVVWQCSSGYKLISAEGNANQFYLVNSEKKDRYESLVTHSLPLKTERLSLGNNKSQDWEMIKRRKDLSEIFPHWLALGQLSQRAQLGNDFQYVRSLGGNAAFLDQCQEAINIGKPEELLEPFANLFCAGFDGVLSLRLEDLDYQGFELRPVAENVQMTPMALLSEGAKLIRRLFVQQDNQTIQVLPHLPPAFHCGRFLKINCEEKGILELEWSKKHIRRMIFLAAVDGDFHFIFQKGIKRYRLRRNLQEKGIIVSENKPLSFVAGQCYLFDNFEK